MFSKIAVVTPYHSESAETLLKCMRSVQEQTIPCLHYLVADCEGQLAAHWAHRHIILGESHHDYGNTPRAIGAMLAISEGADAVCFLDADNTYDPDHIETCLAVAQANPDLDYIAAKRRILLPDGTFVTDEEEPGHVDSSCFFLLPGAFYAVPQQALQPKELAIVGDRFFLQRLHGLKSAPTGKPTVNYTSNWAIHYQMAGRQAPFDAKKTFDYAHLVEWWKTLSDREKDIVFRKTGIMFDLS